MQEKYMSEKKASQELSQDDIIEFFKEKKRGIVVKSFYWWGPLRSRLWAFVAMLKGYFSLREFFQFLLPSSFGERTKLMDRYHAFLSKEFGKECPSFPDNCFSLFGHKFGRLDYYITISLINEIILLDQYHAKQFIKNNSIIIDAGANIGTFSVFAAYLAPQGRVYSFEPVTGTFQILKRNAEDYPQITCVNSGLGDEVSKKNIFVDSKITVASIFEDSPYYHGNDGKEDRKTETASILTIDAFVVANDIPRIDFIKIDTEGYEAKILKGARETIKKWKPVIAMSAYHNPNDKEDLPQIMKEICPDYICELHQDHEEDFICYVKK